MSALTLAELLQKVERLGGDPATTTVRVNGYPIDMDEPKVYRDKGEMVVDFDQDLDGAW